jgi:hypothetical protein
MIRNTREIAWVVTTIDDSVKDSIPGAFYSTKAKTCQVLCEKHEDIQTGAITWKPVPVVKEGKITL